MNGTVRFQYRHLVIPTLVAVVMSACFSTAAVAAGPNLAGHWRVVYYLRCSHALQYAPACAAAAQIKLPVVDEKNATFVTQRTLDIFSDARGLFRFQSRVITLEQAPGSNERCHSYEEEVGTFTGICEMASHGKGHIARGKTGLLDFWMEQRTTKYRGRRTYQITRSTVLDTLTPATPGSWDTAHMGSLHGYAGPPNFVFRLSIVHELQAVADTVTVT